MSDRKLRTQGGAAVAPSDGAAILARAEETTSFEIALVVANNAFTQWVGRCAAAAGLAGLAPFDLLILSLINRRLPDKRAADICFALKVEDSHTVAYSLKKLGNAGLVKSQRNGKETLFSTTEEGKTMCERYQAVRRKFLIEALTLFGGEELDIAAVTGLLRALSGMYEQAARNATTGA
jgi:predicted MarR family transcription regulator